MGSDRLLINIFAFWDHLTFLPLNKKSAFPLWDHFTFGPKTRTLFDTSYSFPEFVLKSLVFDVVRKSPLVLLNSTLYHCMNFLGTRHFWMWSESLGSVYKTTSKIILYLGVWTWLIFDGSSRCTKDVNHKMRK